MRRVAHAPDLLVAALRDGELEPGLVALMAKQLQLRGARLAVGELYPVAPLVEIGGRHDALHFADIRLRYGLPRMQQRIREFAVVRGKEDPARVEVEAAHGKDSGVHV